MNVTDRQPFLAWPGWAHLKFAWLQTLIVSAWFAVVFIGADWVTAHRSHHVRVHLDAELQIPLVPSFTLVYMSIYALFVAAPFVLRTRREIVMLAVSQGLAIALAGICFLLIPAQLAYRPPADSELGIWRGLFHCADRLNLDYNLVPSLHVALSLICIELFAAHTGRSGKFLLRAWGLLIAVSTLLTHQHHLLDVVTGYVLALGVVKIFAPPKH